MDDNARNKAAYQVDQGILDARGIKMTVEEVAGLSTTKYSERVHSLKLSNEDLAFLKGLRRRIKNRLASQNSRRRSVEHLRRLTRELRAVRACRRDALADRRQLVHARDTVRDKCRSLRRHIVKIMNERCDTTDVPSIDVKESLPTDVNVTIAKLPQISPLNLKPEHISVIVKNDLERDKILAKEDVYEKVRKELQKEIEQQETIIIKEERVFEDNTIIIKEEVPDYDEEDYSAQNFEEDYSTQNFEEDYTQRSFDESQKSFDECQSLGKFDKLDSLSNDIFECKIGKLVQKSVNHMFNNNDKKKVFAKTVFIANEKLTSNINTMVLEGESEVLNLSVKEGRRKSHGRKQSAPRRITCYTDDDGVLDLKIKK